MIDGLIKDARAWLAERERNMGAPSLADGTWERSHQEADSIIERLAALPMEEDDL